MTNNTIILDEVFSSFTADQRAEMVHKMFTAEQVAAYALRIDFKDKSTTEAEKLDAAAAYILADNLHTFSEWKKAGRSVKPGEHAALVCYLWKYSGKPRKSNKNAAQAQDDAPANLVSALMGEGEDDGSGYFYKTKTHLFGAWQVESTEERDKRQNVKPMTRGELIAYNKKLAEQRKAQKPAAQPAPVVQDEQPAEVIAIIPAAVQPAPVAAQNAQLDFAGIAAGLIG